MVLNLAMIVALLFLVKSQSFGGIRILSLSVLIGGFGQLLIQVPALLRKGMPAKIMTVFRHPEVKKIVFLMGPATLGLAVYQINIVVDTIFGSYQSIVGEGAIAALYYGNRLMQLPLAIFGIAMATAVFPLMAGQVSQVKTEEFKKTLLFALKTVFFLIIPSSVGLIVLRQPIVSLLFERNAFGLRATADTATALLYYSLGLFAYAGVQIINRAFYSLQDTKTPVKVAGLTMLINIILNLVLMRPLGLGGLALATSLAAGINFFLLLYLLSKKTGGIAGKAILSSLGRIASASLFMGFVCYLAAKALSGEAGPVSLSLKFLQVLVPVSAGIITLFMISLLFKFEEMKLLRKIIFHGK
jgi:putative peptidoglycan lipid II flippase